MRHVRRSKYFYFPFEILLLNWGYFYGFFLSVFLDFDFILASFPSKCYLFHVEIKKEATATQKKKNRNRIISFKCAEKWFFFCVIGEGSEIT